MLFGAFYIAAAVLAVYGGEGKVDKKAAAEQLLRETVALTDSLSWADRLSRLQRIVYMNRRLAAAHYELARVRMEKDTIENRLRAAEAIERAVQLEPGNSEYHYTCGMLHLRRGMDHSASREFRKTIKLNPGDPRPYHQLGLLAEERMLYYRDMFNVEEGGILDLRSYADEDYLEAESYFENALAMDPKFAESYYRLALLYYESGRLEQMAMLLQQAIRHGIGNKDHYLFLGLAYHELGDDEAARRAYETALALMPVSDRELFELLRTVLPPDSVATYHFASAPDRAENARKFWAARDPLYLTLTNERLMEHYGRVAYANLRYSFPFKKIEGWKTDRGKTLIRFGRPRRHYKTRADLTTSPTGHMQLDPSREVWDYGDFQLVYEDRFLNRNYAFAWGWLPETDSKYVFNQLIKSLPERYHYPYGGRQLALPHVIAQFRGQGDSTQIEIYYGIAEAQVQPGAVSPQAARFLFDRGFFLFDAAWRPLREKREPRVLDAATSNDGSGFVIDRLSLTVPAGDYAYALEIRDRISQHSGSTRSTLAVEDLSGASLKMSSVLLASQVAETDSERRPGIYAKDGLEIIPVLTNQFSAGAPVYVYYEVYNLQRSADGFCRYRIDSRVEPVPDKPDALAGALRGVGRLLGLHRQRTAITSSFESGSMSSTEKMYHAVEITGARPGQYYLTLRLTDTLSGQTVARRVTLEIVGGQKNTEPHL